MIPFYSFKEIHKNIEQDLCAVASNVISSGNYVFSTQKFEEEFADYVGSKFCAAVSNGTAALHISLLSLGVGQDDEVITVGHTFRATVAAIKYCQATPVLIDIDPRTYTMDVDQVERAITSKTRCIIPVHIYGNAVNMAALQIISKKYNIPIIEDCSQAHGTTIDSQHVGTFGNIGTFSFYPGKGLGALGDAGCIVTNDENIYKFICKARQWDDYDVGYNYRMANIQAEFLRVKLKGFNEVLEIKRSIANEYNKHFNYIFTNNNVKHSYHVYPILVKDRDSFITNVKNDIELKGHYPIPVHKLYSYRLPFSLPVTEHVSAHEVSLPIYPGVDYKKVIEIVNDQVSSLL